MAVHSFMEQKLNTSTNTPILTELVPRTNTALFIIWWWISKKAIKWHNIALKSMKRNITQSNFALKTRYLSFKQECLCFWCSAPSYFTLIMWADRSARYIPIMHRANPTGFSNTLDESASCRNQALCKNRNAKLHKRCHAFSPTPLGSTWELLVKIECKWSAYTAIKENQPVLYTVYWHWTINHISH